MNTLTVVTVFFLLSLLGAVVLFKFFRSSALIKGKTYQAGGAIAGFVILFAVLGTSYLKVENFQKVIAEKVEKLQEVEAKNEVLKEKLEKQTEIQTIAGRLIGYDYGTTKVVLAIRETNADSKGKYRFKARFLNPEEDFVRIYVIREGNIPDNYGIYYKKDMDNFDIRKQ